MHRILMHDVTGTAYVTKGCIDTTSCRNGNLHYTVTNKASQEALRLTAGEATLQAYLVRPPALLWEALR